MRVHQFLTSYSYGDAIGNEAREIQAYLRAAGVQSEIFALFYHPRYADRIINYREYDRYSDAGNIILFHFSIGSPVTRKFLQVPDKKVMIYHNITPYHFFLDYHRVLAKDCYKGRIELKNLAPKVDLALGDSRYNEQELIDAGFKRTGVLPLVMNFEKFNQPIHPVLETLFADGKTNILYVGRIIPNKKIEDVIKIFHFYRSHFNSNSRLFIIGEYRGFERYLHSLQSLVARLETPDIHFSGHVPDRELISYFKLAHLYLHMSEHEGFCAPIPESFYLDIPVIAFSGGAVAETMKGGGVLVHRKQPLEIAALMDRILRDNTLNRRLRAGQRQALKAYREDLTGKTLMRYLKELQVLPGSG